MSAMKIITRLIAAILFIGFFFFALKNTQDVTLRFFLGYERTDALVIVILVCFVVGAILGVLAMTPAVFRHRREAMRHKRTIAAMQRELDDLQRGTQPPQPDTVIVPAHLI
jgi:putative membrane protein